MITGFLQGFYLMMFSSYHQFCNTFNTIQSPTCVIFSTSTLTDRILTTIPLRVSWKDTINVGVFDHQLIFCTRKISRLKKSLREVNYENVGDVNEAYSDFFQKLMSYWQNRSLWKQASERKCSKMVWWLGIRKIKP